MYLDCGYFVVSWGCWENTLLCKTCLHAVYLQPIKFKTLYLCCLDTDNLKQPKQTSCKSKINLQKSLKLSKFNEQSFRTPRKSCKFQVRLALSFFLENNLGKAYLFIRDLKQSWSKVDARKDRVLRGTRRKWRRTFPVSDEHNK